MSLCFVKSFIDYSSLIHPTLIPSLFFQFLGPLNGYPKMKAAAADELENIISSVVTQSFNNADSTAYILTC